MSENESQRFSLKVKLALIVVGILLSVSLAVLGAHILSSPYTIGQGITINNSGGPTIEIGEEVQPEASNQSPTAHSIDLSPHARFESQGETYANVSGWTSTYMELDQLDVSGTYLNTTRNGNNVSIEGAAQSLHIRDSFGIDSTADVRVFVTGQTDISLSQPSSTADYLKLVDTDTGDVVAIQSASDDTIDVTISQDRNLTFKQESVSTTNPVPENGVLLNETTQNVDMAVKVDHPYFDTNQAVKVTFKTASGGIIGSDTLRSSGWANTTYNAPDLGPNDWYVETNGTENVQSSTWTFKIPHELEIRDELTNELLDSGTTKVTVRFFEITEGNVQVITRNTTNGVISLKGLPANADFVIDAQAEWYYNRSIIIRDISKQQTAYMLNKNGSSVRVGFEIEDKTGDFPAETSRVLIRKPIQTSNTTYKTIVGDTFGANSRVNAHLEVDGRYRIVVENAEGDQRSFGTYVADTQNDLVPLEIGDISIDPPEEDGYVLDARQLEIDYNGDQRQAIRVVYRDDSETTNFVRVNVYEQFNESNQIYGPEEYTGNTVSDTILVPETQENVSAWVVNYTIDRGIDDEIVTGTTLVGDLSEPNWPVGQRLLSILGLGGVLLVAGLFGGRLSKIGGVVVSVIAWTLTMIGILAIPIEFLVAALAIAVLFLVSSSDSGGGVPV